MNNQTVTIGSHTVQLSNLEKMFYPDAEFSKGDIIEYYRRIAPAILPHVKGFPVVMKRYPSGVEGEAFYERRCPPGRPEWIPTREIPAQTEKPVYSCIINDEASIIWLANLANIEIHTLLYRSERIGIPTSVVFDLDPGAPADILDCTWVALRLRETLNHIGLDSRVKTSGGKGLHLVIPLNGPADFEKSNAFAKKIARDFERKYPERVTANIRRVNRVGKVLIDWSQNTPHKSTVAPYSLRAKSWPSVSTPVMWEELEQVLRSKDREALEFVAEDVVTRVEEYGDLFGDVLTRKQAIPEY